MTLGYYDSAARRHRAVEELFDLLANGPLIYALVERDLKIRYKRSVFGVAWTFINPMAMLLVLSLAFTGLFARDAPDYPFFVIPGLLLWNFVSQTTMTVAREVAIGVDLWRRVRLPKSALVVATTLTGLTNLLIAVGALILGLFIARRPLDAALVTLPLTILLTAVFVLGVALLLAAAAIYFPDIADIYNVLLPALLFTAPIVYPSSVVTTGWSRLLRLNPLTAYVEAFRAPLYGAQAPSMASFAVMVGIAVAMVAAGWLAFTHSIDDIPYQI